MGDHEEVLPRKDMKASFMVVSSQTGREYAVWDESDQLNNQEEGYLHKRCIM